MGGTLEMINEKLEEYNLNCNVCRKDNKDNLELSLSPSMKNFKKEFDDQVQNKMNAKIDLDKSITSFIKKRNAQFDSVQMDDFPEEFKEKQFDEVFKEPTISFTDGDVFKGGWNKSKKRTGYGVSISKDNVVCKGIWNDDCLDEYCQIVDPKGNFYNGEVKEGQANGQGSINIDGKVKYKGNFVNNVPSGNGRLEDLEKKYVYEGDFLDGKKNGRGKIEFTEGGVVYEGEFVNDKYEGQGKLVYPGEFEYEGSFKNNKFDGEGTMKYDDGRKYDGEFRNGVKDGQGKFTWDENNYYDGNWINDLQHGQGVLVMDGKELNGIFKFGKLIMTDM